jgi:hypothetical protein
MKSLPTFIETFNDNLAIKFERFFNSTFLVWAKFCSLLNVNERNLSINTKFVVAYFLAQLITLLSFCPKYFENRKKLLRVNGTSKIKDKLCNTTPRANTPKTFYGCN